MRSMLLLPNKEEEEAATAKTKRESDDVSKCAESNKPTMREIEDIWRRKRFRTPTTTVGKQGTIFCLFPLAKPAVVPGGTYIVRV